MQANSPAMRRKVDRQGTPNALGSPGDENDRGGLHYWRPGHCEISQRLMRLAACASATLHRPGGRRVEP